MFTHSIWHSFSNLKSSNLLTEVKSLVLLHSLSSRAARFIKLFSNINVHVFSGIGWNPILSRSWVNLNLCWFDFVFLKSKCTILKLWIFCIALFTNVQVTSWMVTSSKFPATCADITSVTEKSGKIRDSYPNPRLLLGFAYLSRIPPPPHLPGPSV